MEGIETSGTGNEYVSSFSSDCFTSAAEDNNEEDIEFKKRWPPHRRSILGEDDLKTLRWDWNRRVAFAEKAIMMSVSSPSLLNFQNN